MTNTETTSKRPTHRVYAVTKAEGADKGFWTTIGAAWPHEDGKGLRCEARLSAPKKTLRVGLCVARVMLGASPMPARARQTQRGKISCVHRSNVLLPDFSLWALWLSAPSARAAL